MIRSPEEITSAAMSLSPLDKAKLAEQLVESIDTADQAQIDAVWIIEIRRRLRELDEGKAHTIPADEVFKSIEARRPRSNPTGY